jgi:4-amino-4-deoxy-L-arabinose transferase-like glycosyltransferase
MSLKTVMVGFLLVALFLSLRLTNITLLPVFADEAIYIRWSQLMQDDFPRFAFFPLQDGKPPLFMLALYTFLPLFPQDPLLASRLVSVLFGLVNMGLIGYLTKIHGGSTRAGILAAGLYAVLPYTLVYDRMGLLDTMVTTWIILQLIGLMLVVKERRAGLAVLAWGIGLALWTKTSTLLFLPALFWLGAVAVSMKPNQQQLKSFCLAVTLGLAIFLVMRLSPSFGTLFARSQDFTFSINEVLQGQVSQIGGNLWALSRWLFIYTTFPVMALWFFIPTIRIRERYVIPPIAWLIAAIIFLIPFMIFGKVVASRYLLPVVALLIPPTIMALKQVWKRHPIAAWVIVGLVVMQSGWFSWPLLTNPDTTPFPKEDRVQYLTEWSSGHGIAEVRDFIVQEAGANRVVVATEGYFGTLPDGLFMYFHRSPLLDRVEIYGIGQPVHAIPETLKAKATGADTYLLVNSHRMRVSPTDPAIELIAEYPRPDNAPRLQLYRIRP